MSEWRSVKKVSRNLSFSLFLEPETCFMKLIFSFFSTASFRKAYKIRDVERQKGVLSCVKKRCEEGDGIFS